MQELEGFDYRAQRPAQMPARDWQVQLSKVVYEGGYRRVENGETFAHDRTGKILFEVYGNVRL